LTLGSGADQIMLYYFGRAHTNGDTWVVFPSARAMHSGDAFAVKGFPNIDAANGGSTMEYGKTQARAAAAIKNVDTIINGHIATGPTQFSDLQFNADFNNDFARYVENAVKANKTVEQAAAEYKVPEKYSAAGYQPAPSTGRGNIVDRVRAGYTELGK
jgi:glyoxylase-like metal-dependent hydrolase (beta-lactamase superfamily II)